MNLNLNKDRAVQEPNLEIDERVMAALTVVTVALMMSWVLPDLEADLKKIDLNTAMIEELMTLDGIGFKVAERIMAFRDANGAFQKTEDLMMVKGIGMKLYEINRDRLVAEGKINRA